MLRANDIIAVMRDVCVFGASGSELDDIFYQEARRLGALLARSGCGLVFGGGNTGLMGAVARGVREAEGHIIGVIPEKLNVPGIAYPGCDELIVTATMHERKAKMESLSSAYIALPGGYGTLEELMEVLTLNQLGYMRAPVVILNTADYYAPLIRQLDDCERKRFASPRSSEMYRVAANAEEAIFELESFELTALPDKIKEALRHNV